MTLDTFLLFGPACFALNMAFGPNNLLSMTNGARYGTTSAVAAGMGRLVAFAIMIVVTALGLGVLLTTSEVLFSGLKWLGAAYLIWIGIKILRSKGGPPLDGAIGSSTMPLRKLMAQEFMIAAANPKAILIFTAFFPQFIDQQNYWSSFATLGVIFLVFEVISITIYSLAGARLKHVLKHSGATRWIDRTSGTMMVIFGLAMTLTQRPT